MWKTHNYEFLANVRITESHHTPRDSAAGMAEGRGAERKAITGDEDEEDDWTSCEEGRTLTGGTPAVLAGKES